MKTNYNNKMQKTVHVKKYGDYSEEYRKLIDRRYAQYRRENLDRLEFDAWLKREGYR